MTSRMPRRVRRLFKLGLSLFSCVIVAAVPKPAGASSLPEDGAKRSLCETQLLSLGRVQREHDRNFLARLTRLEDLLDAIDEEREVEWCSGLKAAAIDEFRLGAASLNKAGFDEPGPVYMRRRIIQLPTCLGATAAEIEVFKRTAAGQVWVLALVAMTIQPLLEWSEIYCGRGPCLERLKLHSGMINPSARVGVARRFLAAVADGSTTRITLGFDVYPYAAELYVDDPSALTEVAIGPTRFLRVPVFRGRY